MSQLISQYRTCARAQSVRRYGRFLGLTVIGFNGNCDNFNLACDAVRPPEAHTILLVQADRILCLAAFLQRFQRNPWPRKVGQLSGCVQFPESAKCGTFDVPELAADELTATPERSRRERARLIATDTGSPGRRRKNCGRSTPSCPPTPKRGVPDPGRAAVLAPMPRAGVTTAVKVKAGLRRRARVA